MRWTTAGADAIHRPALPRGRLVDAPRPGAARTISDEVVEVVVVGTLETTPKDAAHWSARSMAQRHGISRQTVSEIWRAFGLKPWRPEEFKISPDPDLIEKIPDLADREAHAPFCGAWGCDSSRPPDQAVRWRYRTRLSRTGDRPGRYGRRRRSGLPAGLEFGPGGWLAGQRAAVVGPEPGEDEREVALHRTAYLLYADPRLGHRRGGVLFIGPHQPYLAYVAGVLPSLGEEGVQIATLRDLLPEGAAAAAEPDPEVARLKSSADLVRAIEPAVRFYENPPAGPVTVRTPWSDLELSAADWAGAFGAPDPGTPHNEAREVIFEELLTILTASRGSEVPADLLRKSLLANRELRAALNRAWPLIEPANLVGDLFSVPAYLRLCAPWLSPGQVRRLQRADARAWTVPDLPLLDAARRRLGDPQASRRQRRRDAALAAGREQMTRVLDDLSAAADDEYGVGLVTMLRGQDFRDALADQAALPGTDPDRLAGPFAHIVVDEAQELTDAEWQMLLARCPSRSFTIAGDRAQARHGFTGTWQDRLRADRPRPGQPGHPEHQLPDTARGHGRSRAAHPGRAPGRQRARLHPQHRHPRHPRTRPGPGPGPGHLARRARRRDRRRHRRPRLPGHIPRPVANPRTGQRTRVQPGHPHQPAGIRHRHRRNSRPLRRDDPGHPATHHPHQLLPQGQHLTRNRTVSNS